MQVKLFFTQTVIYICISTDLTFYVLKSVMMFTV